MKLVKHVERGYGHALQQPDGKWLVWFFDDYGQACLFSEHPNNHILTFPNEDTDYD